MKKVSFLLCIVLILSVSCDKIEDTPQVSSINFTTCKDEVLKSNSLNNKIDIKFTKEGVEIKYYDFEVSCDFTTVNVSHTFENGFLNIVQQGFPNEANCICYTDVSYKINNIKQDEVNLIFINGEQVYCHNDEQPTCDQDVIIDPVEYENAPNSHLFIVDMQIVDNCLKIKFASSGCSGKTWIVKLIDNGSIAESIPCQRTLRLSLDNQEACAAVFEKELSFNIESLQVYGDNKVQLNISGTPILYEY